mmetsp:Transcript_47986/g.102758  ORF Transcript_47986/g.102758 Transcript_47986/m.102758 type:complete len:426 (+) Transcript_47986:41-1318(+)
MKLFAGLLVSLWGLPCEALNFGNLRSGRKGKSYRQTLHNFQNVQYFADFELGGQDISGIFDTGSFELLVRSTRCSSCEHPTAPYDRSQSDSYSENGTLAKHVFGSGPCVSMKGYEEVIVGPLKSKKQTFWEIVDHKIEVLNTAKFAAIVGIGPNFGYGSNDSTLLMNFGVNEFSICLQRAPGSDGFMTWGKENADSYKDKHFAKANVIGQHHWVTRMYNVRFNDDALNTNLANVPCTAGGCAAIIDSGTSLIAAPGQALQQLSNQIEPIMEDCSNLHLLPTLRFNIDGTEFELPPEAYVMRITGEVSDADSIWDIFWFNPKVRKVHQCMPAFMQMDMQSRHGPVWILGMPFFRYYHTTFDREAKAMYFATAGANCSAQPFSKNASASLLGLTAEERKPMDVDLKQIVQPTLSSQIDDATDRDVDL